MGTFPMAKEKYLQAPLPSKEMPKGIPYIISNECAERFSFYGMKTILTVFMTQYLMNAEGNLDVMSETEATTWFHVFTSAVYFTPILGALLSDIILAKYKTILSLSVVYCLGHLVLAMDDTRWGLALGLMLISCGSGGIKPCVSAHVGDQFGKTNQHLLTRVFGWFYFSINLGSFFSTLITPYLLPKYGPNVAFGVPGALMLLATIVFWMGRYKFVHIPPGGTGFIKETFSGNGLRAILRLGLLYIFVAMFWALFDQTGSSWVLQAQKMDRYWLRFEWFSSQIQAANPLLVMIMIPLFARIIYPGLNKIFRLTPLRKISIGLFVAAASFAVIAMAERNITGGDIIKYSSQPKTESLSHVKLIDGNTNTTGWASSRAPDPNRPEEIVIRLRERKAWAISSVEIDPAAMLGYEEMTDIFREMTNDYRKQNKIDKSKQAKAALNELEDNISWKLSYFFGSCFFDSLEEKVRAEKDTTEALKPIGQKALEELGENPRMLEDYYYYPKEINVFCADFSDKLLPEFIYELPKDKQAGITDAKEYASANGWTHLGTMKFSENGAVQTLEFFPIKATHVYIHILSNFGADRVKLEEIKVLTEDPLPEDTQTTVQEIGPNVAAIGYRPNIVWQIIAYIILTAAEVMVSITCLEFSYTQAPRKMKSFIMSIYLLSVSLGNAFTAGVNAVILKEDGTSKLAGAQYFWFFTLMMLITAVIFIPLAAKYRTKEYIQEESPVNNQE